jgi:hypothetical protein
MKKTPIFILLTVLLITVYDFYIIVAQGSSESISAYIIKWSYEFPAMTFFSGFVAGHLFWRMRRNEATKEIDK